MSKDDHPKLLLAASAACLVGGVLWLILKPSPPVPVAPPPAQAPKPKPMMRLPAVQPVKPSPLLVEPAVKPAPPPTAVSATTLAAPVPSKRDKAAWEALLAKIAPEGYEKTHPGVLKKLATLLAQHPGDEAWEAGAAAYLTHGLKGEDRFALWRRAAEALPENLAISDALVRSGLDVLVPSGRFKDIDILLDQQIARTPQDAHLLWIKVAVAFKDGRGGENAEALLQKAADLPPWKGRSGVAEYADLQVCAAMDGPMDPIDRIQHIQEETAFPDMNLYRDLAKGAVGMADTLTKGWEYDRVRNLLIQADRASHGMEDGANLPVTLLVGMAVEGQVLRAQKGLATTTGDVILLQDAERRLAELKARVGTAKAWCVDQGAGWSQIASAYQQLGVSLWDPNTGRLNDRIKEIEPFLIPDDRELLRHLSESDPHQMDDLRARIAATPPTP